jgi:hypothetical protein
VGWHLVNVFFPFKFELIVLGDLHAKNNKSDAHTVNQLMGHTPRREGGLFYVLPLTWYMVPHLNKKRLRILPDPDSRIDNTNKTNLFDDYAHTSYVLKFFNGQPHQERAPI